MSGEKKVGLGFTLSLFFLIGSVRHDTEQSQQHRRTVVQLCQQRTEAKCNLSIDDVIFQMRSTERHSQAITTTLLLTYHLGRANPVCEHCKANLCQCSCCSKGSACAPWCVSLGSWGWDALEFTPRQLKGILPALPGKYQGKQWEVLKTDFPHLLSAEQQLRASLLPLTEPATGISLSQGPSRWKGKNETCVSAEKTVTGEKSTF